MKLVLKIGGSLLFDEDQTFDLARVKEFKGQNHDLVLVVGGGILAKILVERGKGLGANREALDQLGIAATWVCAQMMIAALHDIAYPIPIMTEDQLANLVNDEKLLILGGLHPGQSTNAVAARAAEITRTEVLINVTDVDGVYDRDPRQSSEANLLSKISLDQLRDIVSSLASEPGTYPLFDKRALDIVERARVEVWFINGLKPSNILQAINEGKIGTRVVVS